MEQRPVVPPPHIVRDWIGQLLRDLRVARRLLTVSKLNEDYNRTSNSNVTPAAREVAAR